MTDINEQDIGSLERFMPDAGVIQAAIETIAARTGQDITGGILFIEEEAAHVFGTVDVDELASMARTTAVADELLEEIEGGNPYIVGYLPSDAYAGTDDDTLTPICLATISDRKYAHACGEDKGHDDGPDATTHYDHTTGRYWADEDKTWLYWHTAGRIDGPSVVAGLLAGAVVAVIVLTILRYLSY